MLKRYLKPKRQKTKVHQSQPHQPQADQPQAHQSFTVHSPNVVNTEQRPSVVINQPHVLHIGNQIMQIENNNTDRDASSQQAQQVQPPPSAVHVDVSLASTADDHDDGSDKIRSDDGTQSRGLTESSPEELPVMPAVGDDSSDESSLSAEMITISAELEQCIRDGQRLITYISRNGNALLDPTVTENIIQAKMHLATGQWTVAQEQKYLLNYDQLAKSVYPVTVESINAIIPDKMDTKPSFTKAQRAVRQYRIGTMLALIIMLIAQLYWLLGNELKSNLDATFAARSETLQQIQQMEQVSGKKEQSSSPQLLALHEQLKEQNQEFDANYNMLKFWNQIWMIGYTFPSELPTYFNAKYQYESSNLFGEALVKLKLERTLHEIRIVYFENLLAADFVLNAFQAYLLPLLYGLLGACIYVLRSLMGEIKTLTYSYDSEIRFRLRLTLGALGGMIIGWFLKPDDASGIASLSPLALAFFMGYNVDVLFTFMDNLIQKVNQSLNRSTESTPSQSTK